MAKLCGLYTFVVTLSAYTRQGAGRVGCHLPFSVNIFVEIVKEAIRA